MRRRLKLQCYQDVAGQGLGNMKIRNAKKSDAKALAGLAGELGYPTSATEMESRLENIILERRNAVFVAELDLVVGWIHVSLIQSLESGSFAEIRGLVVKESRRNAGVGTALVAAAESWALKNGCRQIRVRTNSVREKAKTFYKNLGFQQKKTQEVFDKILGGEPSI